MLSGQIRKANESARIVDPGHLEVGYRLPDLAAVFSEPLDHFGGRPLSVQPQTLWMSSRATSRVEFLVGMETVPREMDCVDVGHDKAMRTAAPWS
jgi:hypothetical protein